MVDYNLYKSSDNITPFVIVQENTIDSSSTSIKFIGKRKEAYGEPQNQSLLWLLENFADDTQPLNAINGQAWYNTLDNKLYVCVDELSQTFEKVGNPLASGTAPTINLDTGNLWFNTLDGRLYAWDGTEWVVIGPQSGAPLTVKEEVYLSRITSTASTVELWLNGVTNVRKTIDNNTTWLFEISLVARRVDADGERRTWRLTGQLNNTTNTVTLDGGVSKEVLSLTSGTEMWNVVVTSDNINKSIAINVTGDAGKTIQWNAIMNLTKVS